MQTNVTPTPEVRTGNLIKTPFEFRYPEAADGQRVHQLVSECRPLDENSTYCNLLQCTHFSDTSVCATDDDNLVGFISGYVPPRKPNVLFIWQVAIRDSARGQGLAGRMLDELLNREFCKGIQFIETSIAPDNDASWAMFRKFANRHHWKTEQFILFDSRLHFAGEHKDEHLLRIGPFNRDRVDDVLGH